jgi:MYXO-CTERM domain-containing protein
MRRVLMCFAYAGLLAAFAACGWGGTLYTFEAPTYAGSGGGVGLNGQDGWLASNGNGDATVRRYADIGAPVPFGGGGQFIVVIGPNVQDTHSASFTGASVWDVSFDIFVNKFDSNYTSAGSFFLFRNGTGYQIHAFPGAGQGGTWNADFDVFDSTGGRINGANPGAGFAGLQMNQWYQEQIVFDTATNRILSVAIGDPANPSAAATYDPSGWYLYGGASAPFSVGGLGVFAYGTLAFDNISLDPVPTPEPASWGLGLAGAAALGCLRARRRQRQPRVRQVAAPG